jgi:hypothetical protein
MNERLAKKKIFLLQEHDNHGAQEMQYVPIVVFVLSLA